MSENNTKIDSKYRFILLAAKRARQLQGGAKPLIHTTSRKTTRIAQEELKAGMLHFDFPPLPGSEIPPKPQPPAKKGK